MLEKGFVETLDCQKGKQVHKIRPELSLEAKMLKLKLSYFGHIMRRQDSLEKTLMLGRVEGSRKR